MDKTNSSKIGKLIQEKAVGNIFGQTHFQEEYSILKGKIPGGQFKFQEGKFQKGAFYTKSLFYHPRQNEAAEWRPARPERYPTQF